MVAIPSLFCYNFLVTKIKALTMELDNFAAHLETVFMTEYLRPKDQFEAAEQELEEMRPRSAGEEEY